MTLDEISITLVYSAMAVYAIAFIAYAIDLARRSAVATRAADEAKAAAAAAPVAVGAGAAAAAGTGGTGASTSTPAKPVSGAARGAASVAYGRSPALRVGVAMTVIAWALHLAADVTRGLAAGRVPWANMYEFALTGTLVITTVYLLVLVVSKHDLRFLGTFVTGLVLVLLGIATVNFYVEVAPLPPALQSAWLVIHVFVATLGTGFFAVGAGLSIAQLLQARRESGRPGLAFLRTFPSSTVLENLAYRVVVVGFAFWTFTLIAGAIWAEHAWGRYWGWDTKEVWTFIIWVLFAGYIHARATRGWRGARSAWLAIVGFSAVLFNFTIVNLFFKGLHAYSGL